MPGAENCGGGGNMELKSWLVEGSLPLSPVFGLVKYIVAVFIVW